MPNTSKEANRQLWSGKKLSWRETYVVTYVLVDFYFLKDAFNMLEMFAKVFILRE